jgi:hypothetical protein
VNARCLPNQGCVHEDGNEREGEKKERERKSGAEPRSWPADENVKERDQVETEKKRKKGEEAWIEARWLVLDSMCGLV